MSDSETSYEDRQEEEVEMEAANEEEETALQNVRSAVQEWKVREIGKNKETNANVQGFYPLRKYVSNAARLYYDLITFLKTSKNNETNMLDKHYVNIISAIGIPGALPYTLKTLIQHMLQRDLIELPYTMEPAIINAHAKEGNQATTEFPEEE